MEYHSREVKAGLLLVLGFLALVAFMITITGIDWEKKEKTYTARFDYIGGIERGALVRFGGFLVGNVTDMYLAPDDNTKIEVELTVDARTPVRKDSEAFITTINLMGEFYIEISTGSAATELLPSGERLRSRDVPPLARLSEPFMNVSEQLNILLVRANDLLNDTNRKRLGNILANADSVFSSNTGDLIGILDNLNAITLQMESLSGKLDHMMAENSESLRATLLQINHTLAVTDTLLHSLNRTAVSVNDLAASNQASLQETLQSFEHASQNLEQFSRTIKERPWNLIRKSSPPERELR